MKSSLTSPRSTRLLREELSRRARPPFRSGETVRQLHRAMQAAGMAGIGRFVLRTKSAPRGHPPRSRTTLATRDACSSRRGSGRTGAHRRTSEPRNSERELKTAQQLIRASAKNVVAREPRRRIPRGAARAPARKAPATRGTGSSDGSDDRRYHGRAGASVEAAKSRGAVESWRTKGRLGVSLRSDR